MSINESIANRVRELIAEREKNVEEKKMFGGLCFMVNDKMCVGVELNRIMVRFDPDKTAELMEKDGVTPMDFTQKVMKGYAFVDINVLNTKDKLEYWIKLALDYNKIAKPSKKRNSTKKN
jgi:TfoX/Sxy family transcriptional regulator of competence genes